MMATISVSSRMPWFDTGIDVAAGDTLAVTATGVWKDWFIACGPEGYEKWHLAPFHPLRRVPSARWFALIGTFGKDLTTAFIIGRHSRREVGIGGRLYLFANDISGMYFNNSGEIEVTISWDPE